jgi:hypothetical protein
MLAPKPGRELRDDLRERLRRMPNDRADLPNGESVSRDPA